MPFVELNKGKRFPGPNKTEFRNIKGGVITAQELILAGGTSGTMRSQNFNPTNETGWAFKGDGTVYLYDSLVLGSDFYSTNWDGAIPANLLIDEDNTATAGFYYDNSSGSMQFQDGNIYVVSGHISVGDSDLDSIRIDGFAQTLSFFNNLAPWGGTILNSWAATTGGFMELLSITGNNNAFGGIKIMSAGSSTANNGVDIFTSVVGGVTNKLDNVVYVQLDDTLINYNGMYMEGVTDVFSLAFGPIGGDATPNGGWQGGSTPGGFLTDQTNGFLPAMEYAPLDDLTTITASTWTTVDATNRPVIPHGSASNKVRAYGHGATTVDNTSGSGTTLARARVRVSLDGGATWTNGKAARVDVAAGGRGHLHPGVQVNGTPTANIVCELQVLSTDTATNFVTAWARVEALGDL